MRQAIKILDRLIREFDDKAECLDSSICAFCQTWRDLREIRALLEIAEKEKNQ